MAVYISWIIIISNVIVFLDPSNADIFIVKAKSTKHETKYMDA